MRWASALGLMEHLAIPLSNLKTIAKWLVISTNEAATPQAAGNLTHRDSIYISLAEIRAAFQSRKPDPGCQTLLEDLARSEEAAQHGIIQERIRKGAI